MNERKAEGLFVEQLIQVADISDRVIKMMDKAKDDNERKVYQDSALAQIAREYQQRKLERIKNSDRNFL